MELTTFDYQIVDTYPIELKTDAERFLTSLDSKQFVKSCCTEPRRFCEILAHLK